MAYYLIKFIDMDGGVQSKSVEAQSREQAIANSGVAVQHVQSATVDHLGSIRSKFMDKRLSLNEQVLALVTLSSKMESGKTFSRAIIETVDHDSIGISRGQLDSCEKPGDFVKALRFDETAILLTEAGDKAGVLAESLQRAANVIKAREKSRKEFAKPMRTAALNAVFGLAAGIGFPIFGGGMMDSFINVEKMPIEPTLVSNVLMWLNMFYTSFWPLLIGIVVAAYLLRAKIWPVIREWPFFRMFNERNRTKMGLDFIETFQLLTKSGYTNPQTFKFMLDRAKGTHQGLFQQALDRGREGRELGAIFDNPEWPRVIAQNLNGFEQQAPDGRDKVLTNLADTLTEMFTQNSEKIARTLSNAATAIIVGSILLFALGFYVPLVSMRIGVS